LRKPLPQKWWIYGEKRPALYGAISKLDQVMVIGQVAKHPSFDFAEINQVLDAKLVIIANDDFGQFAILQSCLHFAWITKYATTLETRLNYTPTALFETFPFLQSSIESKITQTGKSFYLNRKDLLKFNRLGLTKTYNLFHSNRLQVIGSKDLDLSDKDFAKKYERDYVYLKRSLVKSQDITNFNKAIESIFELRKLQVNLDKEVLHAYGWGDIQLNHNYYEVEYLPENDRIRFTIHPNSRKEILKRLLELNCHLYNSEISDLHKKNRGLANLHVGQKDNIDLFFNP
jgi:hypothetical protein